MRVGGGDRLFAQINLTGVWVPRVPRSDGTFNESYVELKQDGEAISGAMLGNRDTPNRSAAWSGVAAGFRRIDGAA